MNISLGRAVLRSRGRRSSCNTWLELRPPRPPIDCPSDQGFCEQTNYPDMLAVGVFDSRRGRRTGGRLSDRQGRNRDGDRTVIFNKHMDLSFGSVIFFPLGAE
jgi:hypothetical protein